MSDTLKQNVAHAALDHIHTGDVVGVGSGSTVNFFIQALAKIKCRIEGTVASSQATQQHLEALNIPIIPTNEVIEIPVYIDGADEIDPKLRMIKGGGGALTGEKIIAAMSKKFICICDQSKHVEQLGKYPLPIEVIAFAQNSIERKLTIMGATPRLRFHDANAPFITDYGNPIVDVSGLNIVNPCALEQEINQWPGVVSVGLFCCNPADLLLLGDNNGVHVHASTQQ